MMKDPMTKFRQFSEIMEVFILCSMYDWYELTFLILVELTGLQYERPARREYITDQN